MGFTLIGSGIRQPYQAGKTSTQQIKKIHRVTSEHNILEFEEELASTVKNPEIQVAGKVYQQVNHQSQERRVALYAMQIMTSPVISLTPDSHLKEAWDIIQEYRFRHIPITSDNGLIGIISDRDLLREAVKDNYSKTSGKAGTPPEKTIVDLIKTEVLVASPNTEIRQIAKIMFEERIGSMPIINAKGELIGMITRSDILRTLVNQAPLELWV